MQNQPYIHETATVSPDARLGIGTKIWHLVHIREGVRIGENCIIGRGTYIDCDIWVGDRVKIQNYASIYHCAKLHDDVFIGPYACFTNDKYPRATTTTGEIKQRGDWEPGETEVMIGASVGAGAIVLPGLCIGRYSMIAAGTVVTTDVPPHALIMGNPGRVVGHVCKCGKTLSESGQHRGFCFACEEYTVLE